MRTYLLPSSTLLLLALLVARCDAVEEERGGGTVTLAGQVLNSQTNNPVDGAVVRVVNPAPAVTVEADDQGRYRLEVEIDSTMELDVTASKEGYASETITLLAMGGRAITVPPFRLVPTSDLPSASGQAASLVLLSQSTEALGVLESGSEAAAELVFQVVDSAGRPVDLAHAVDVRFSLGARPGGGEFLSPTTARTDNNGRAAVTLTSGTRAGTVQLMAEATVGSRRIRSLPVAVAIHGGLPDPSHFSIAPRQLNFPGYDIYGLVDEIAAFVGDKYGNPVRPGTAVYFTTTGGLIQGSVQTDGLGQGVAVLTSAAPQPQHATLGPGFAVVTARTGDETQQTISDEALVLFSGRTLVDVIPKTLAVGQRYRYVVSDRNGNPLSAGTSIRVSVEGEQVRVVGDTDVTLDDTQAKGPGTTEFFFRVLVDADAASPQQPSLESITVRVESPNGDVRATLLSSGELATEASW